MKALYQQLFKWLINVYELSHNPFKSFSVDENGNLQGVICDVHPFTSRASLPKTYYLMEQFI